MNFPRFVRLFITYSIPGYYRFLLVLVPIVPPYRIPPFEVLIGYGYDVERREWLDAQLKYTSQVRRGSRGRFGRTWFESYCTENV